ncbi:hypothetical protein [Allonocardiopsis opalescens]|uniref:Uncharacterized protein n=1 Tax=Allonocardiopsis opalescens TaxID=1144618 RepID=A0A2T0PVI9_9ACTN|nr:hypothetical protein [Allonocardiopsis opalescens]PRX95555.1 hypothetical protein CLV72_109164 [Allonocardiopsis opalescens]
MPVPPCPSRPPGAGGPPDAHRFTKTGVTITRDGETEHYRCDYCGQTWNPTVPHIRPKKR